MKATLSLFAFFLLAASVPAQRVEVSLGPASGTGTGDAAEALPITSITAIGDSITAGYNASDRASRWVARLGTMVGVGVTNLGIPGATIPDLGWMALPGLGFTNEAYGDSRVDSPTVGANSELYVVLPGYNDMRDFGINTNVLAAFERGLGAVIAGLGLGSDRRSAQAATASGAWANSTWHGGSLGRESGSVGASLTWTNLIGDTLYLCYQDGDATTNGGTFSVTVDGFTNGTFSVVATNGYANRPKRTGATNMPPTLGPYGNAIIDAIPSLIRISGINLKPHSLAVSVTSTSTGPVRLVWAGAAVNAGTNTSPRLLVGDTLRQATYSGSGSDTAAGVFSAAIGRIVGQLAGDGIAVRLAPVSTIFDPLTEMASDGVHPTNSGHASIATGFHKHIGDGRFSTDKSADLAGRFSDLEVNAEFAYPAVARFGSNPSITPASSVWIKHGDGLLPRRLILDGNSVRVYDSIGTTQQNLALAGTASDVVTLGASGYGLRLSSGGPLITWVSGSPEGVITAPVGSLAVNTSGGVSTTLYVKTSGTGNTGWTAK